MSHVAVDNAQKQDKARTYLIASLFCLAMTLIPFTLVLSSSASIVTITVVILLTGALQIFTQVFFFLHLDHKPNRRWNIISLVFFLTIIVIVAGGSIWIMHDLNYFMCSCGT